VTEEIGGVRAWGESQVTSRVKYSASDKGSGVAVAVNCIPVPPCWAHTADMLYCPLLFSVPHPARCARPHRPSATPQTGWRPHTTLYCILYLLLYCTVHSLPCWGPAVQVRPQRGGHARGDPGRGSGPRVDSCRGEVQFVEASKVAGRGELHLTGQLRDVIKDRADRTHLGTPRGRGGGRRRWGGGVDESDSA